MGSADWMPRNLDKRVEILFPVEDEELKKEVKRLSNALSYANNRIRQLENQLETYKKEEESKIEEISAIVEKLNKEHQEEVNKLNAKIKQTFLINHFPTFLY